MGVGTAYDVGVNDQSFGTALGSNTIGTLGGQALGTVAKRSGKYLAENFEFRYTGSVTFNSFMGVPNPASLGVSLKRKTNVDTPRGTAVIEGAPKVGLPKVTNPKLSKLVDNLYKGAKGPNPIGTGSTADAVRNELITGLGTHGRFHTQKAQETINGLTNWLRKNPSASHHDRLVAQSLLDDLKAALGGN